MASVTGTDADPQPRAAQVRKLTEAGVIVAESNADAARMAIAAIGMPSPGPEQQGWQSGRRDRRPRMRSADRPDVIVPILRSGVLARAFCRPGAPAEVEAVLSAALSPLR